MPAGKTPTEHRGTIQQIDCLPVDYWKEDSAWVRRRNYDPSWRGSEGRGEAARVRVRGAEGVGSWGEDCSIGCLAAPCSSPRGSIANPRFLKEDVMAKVQYYYNWKALKHKMSATVPHCSPPDGESVDTSCKPPPAPLPPLPPPRESPSPRWRRSNAPSLPPWELESKEKSEKNSWNEK